MHFLRDFHDSIQFNCSLLIKVQWWHFPGTRLTSFKCLNSCFPACLSNVTIACRACEMYRVSFTVMRSFVRARFAKHSRFDGYQEVWDHNYPLANLTRRQRAHLWGYLNHEAFQHWRDHFFDVITDINTTWGEMLRSFEFQKKSKAHASNGTEVWFLWKGYNTFSSIGMWNILIVFWLCYPYNAQKRTCEGETLCRTMHQQRLEEWRRICHFMFVMR